MFDRVIAMALAWGYFLRQALCAEKDRYTEVEHVSPQAGGCQAGDTNWDESLVNSVG